MAITRYLSSISKYKHTPIGIGSFSNVYKCIDKYTDRFVAYKEFCSKEELEKIKNVIIDIMKHYGNNDYVIPFSLICDNKDNSLGYIMQFYEGYKSLSTTKEFDSVYETSTLSIEEKMNIIKKARILVEFFHKNFKFLHGDLAPWNFMYDKYEDHLVLNDFDSSINLSKKTEIYDSVHPIITLDYLKHQKVDEGLDIYLFNLFTYAIINNVNYNDVINIIRMNNYGELSSNEKVKEILNSYKDLGTTKTLKKEYIMDYI